MNLYLSHFFLELGIFWTEVFEKVKVHMLYLINLFPKIAQFMK